MKPCLLLIALMTASLSGAAPQASRTARLADEVRAAEASFARTMAARDHAAFAAHLASEAVFFGANDVLRGRTAVAAGWKRFFDGPTPPFSWEPAQVEVLDSGTLALTSGPVRDPQGRQTGVFNSVWRRDGNGSWKIVFDKGCPPCECAAKP
ncbi:MAG: DUF4440 domain-containing protein [Acidobacteria bacterium]|nr:MAG: DUF4440 domain-containing protein [Acidobacteriota bacterium]